MQKIKDKIATAAISKFALIGAILLILFLFVGCLIMAFLLQGQINQSEFLKVSYQANQQQYDNLNSQLHQVRDSLNREHTKTYVLEADNKSFKALLRAQDQFLIKNLKEFNIKLKDLKSITSFSVESKGEFTTVTRDSVIISYYQKDSIHIDTIRTIIKTIDFSDPSGWFKLKGSIRNDSMNFQPVFRNQFDIAAYREHRPRRYWIDPKFLRSKQTVVEVINKNPYTTTTALKHIIQK